MRRDLLFVVMPWHSLAYPSLGVGILSAIARRAGFNVDTIYANLLWADFLSAETNGKLTPKEYAFIGEDLIFTGAGEWVFAGALQRDALPPEEAYRRYFTRSEADFEKVRLAQRFAPAFIDRLVAEIERRSPKIVGLTSTFLQNVGCLALAKRIKEMTPNITTIMGGGNCDGIMGRTLHRNFPFLDYVVCGEGETAFERFLEFHAGQRTVDTVPNLCWRRGTESISNPPAPTATLSDAPIPEYAEYFSQLDEASSATYVEPNLIIETSRGCWWGEKHHCTFCGLNGTGMKFRRKTEAQVLKELQVLIERHQVLDVITSDNIIDMQFFKTVLPAIVARDWDLRIHYEVKSNLKREQICLLAEAGVRHVQPGLESLSSRVLGLMEKGVTGARNIQTLRDCEEQNLTISWNYLYGFPGESRSDYSHVIAQIPALTHLQPPSGATRIVLERFSPFFDRPSLGFGERVPAPYYALVYGIDNAEVEDMVYMFDTRPQGIDAECADELVTAIDDWKRDYDSGATLSFKDTGSMIEISDSRASQESGQYFMRDGADRAMFRMLEKPLRLHALRKRVEDLGICLAAEEVQDRLDSFSEKGLVFCDDGLFTRTPTRAAPFRTRMNA